MDPTLHAMLSGQRRHLRRVLRWELLARLAVASAVFLWAGLLIDRALEPTPFWRQVGYGIAAAATILWIGRMTLVPLLTPVSDAEIAAVVERRDPAYRDALLTAVSLAGRPGGGFDRGLVGRTTAHARCVLSRSGPPRIVSTKRARRWGAAALVGVGGTVAFCLLQPATAAFYASRLALSTTPWPRRVVLSLEGFIREEDGVWRRRVAAGDTLELRVRASLAQGLESPKAVWLRFRFDGGVSGRVPLARLGDPVRGDSPYQLFRYALEDVRSRASLAIAGGDGRIDPIEVLLSPRPVVTSARVGVTAPAYLGGGERRVPVSALGGIAEGSALDLEVTASKPLRRVDVRWQHADAGAAADATPTVTLSPGAEQFRVACPPLAASRRLLVSLTDETGIASGAPFAVDLRVSPDRLPRAALRLGAVGGSVTPDARIELEGELEDDHGVADARLEFLIDKRPSAPRELPLGPGPVTSDRSTIVLDLLSERFAGGRDAGRLAEGQTLAVRLSVRDRYNLRQADRRTRSREVKLRVVSQATLLAEIEQREMDLRRGFEKTTDEAGRIVSAVTSHGAERRLDRRWSVTLGQVQQETLATGEAFLAILDELRANRIENADLADRVGRQIARPLLTLGRGPLAKAVNQSRREGPPSPAMIGAVTSAEREMRRVLELMKSLETYNEVLALLRGVIDEQQRVRRETEQARRDRLRRRLFE